MKEMFESLEIGLGAGIGYLAIMVLLFKGVDKYMELNPDTAETMNYERILKW